VDVSQETTRDHWWWRPGWSLGRSFYTWHITFDNQPDIHRLIYSNAEAISKFSTLDPVSLNGLHLTIQGVGFVDEVDRPDIDRIIEAARAHCSGLEPFTLRIGPPHVDAETVQMYAQPIEPVVSLRLALRTAIGDVWGSQNIPESMDGFRPHVTLAYSNGISPISKIYDSLRTAGAPVGQASVSRVSLIELNRDHRRYEWTEIATVDLGP
jgi:2'-5' RNA ligase